MKYYVKPSGRDATFILRDKKNHTLAKIDGKVKGSEPLSLGNSSRSDANGYPSFEVVSANGITEIIEHKKMEPIFYVTDSPAVWTQMVGAKPSAY